jgi:ribosomal protein S20
MSFAILRTQKLNAGSIGGANAHNEREINVPNADPELIAFNSRPVGTSNLQNDIETRLKGAGIHKTRKDAVLAIEHVITASPEYFNYKKTEEGGLTGHVNEWKEFQKESLNWLNERYGKENVVNVHIHKDEKTPHIHAIVTPIVQKDVKWKNKRGEGFKTQNRLCAKDYLNGRDKMSAMQDSFSNHLKNAGIGLERGIKGSKATHQEIQKFYTNIKEGEEKKTQKPYQAENITVNHPPTFGKDEFVKSETERINKEIGEMTANFSSERNTLAFENYQLKQENKKLNDERSKHTNQIDKLRNRNKELKIELKTILKDYQGTLNGKTTKEEAEKKVFEKRMEHDEQFRKGQEKGIRKGKSSDLPSF